MTIFIGRNIEVKTKLWLVQNQVSYVAQALIETKLEEANFPFFQKSINKPTAWIVTSNKAVEWMIKHHTSVEIKRNDKFYCISEKQKQALSFLDITILVSNKQNRTSLENLLETENQQEYVFLKGNRTPTIQNLKLREFVVYETSLLKPVLKKEFDAYLFFSPSGVESFVQGGNKISNRSKVFAIGKTTAEAIGRFFRNHVEISEKQEELSFIRYAVNRSYKLKAQPV